MCVALLSLRKHLALDFPQGGKGRERVCFCGRMHCISHALADALSKEPLIVSSSGRDPRQTRSMEDPNLDLQGTERFINQRGEGSHPRKLEGESGALVP